MEMQKEITQIRKNNDDQLQEVKDQIDDSRFLVYQSLQLIEQSRQQLNTFKIAAEQLERSWAEATIARQSYLKG